MGKKRGANSHLGPSAERMPGGTRKEAFPLPAAREYPWGFKGLKGGVDKGQVMPFHVDRGYQLPGTQMAV